MRFVKQLITAAVAATVGFSAVADQDRAQLRAQTAQAVKAGRIPYGEVTRDDAPFVSSRTLAETRAEAASAVAAGRAAGQNPYGEYGVMRYAAARFEPVKSRAQVRGETIEAMRLGLVPYGEAPVRSASAAELESIRLAGVRAQQARDRLAAK